MSTIHQFFWKVWLRLNLLTVDVDNDYTAEVSTLGKTMHNADIAQAIINEGSEIKYDTLLSATALCAASCRKVAACRTAYAICSRA